MLGTVQQTNLNRVFDALDITGDGDISADDFQALARNVRAVRDDVDTELAAEIDQAFSDWWEIFRAAADSDGDGRVSREEFILAVDNGLQNDPKYIDRMMHVSEVAFHAADTDGTGRLTPTQVERIYEAFGVDSRFSAETFSRIDRDGDGFITIDELLQASRDVYRSNDPEAAGVVLFGPVS